MLSDVNSEVCTTYDVIKDKNMYGKIVKGIERSTFIIDHKGKVAALWRKVKVDGHAGEVLEALKKL